MLDDRWRLPVALQVDKLEAASAECIYVHGGAPLQGTVHINGAKNSALKLMAASILAPGESRITNVPAISDVTIMAEVLRSLGARVDELDHELVIDASTIDTVEAPYELVARMRAAVDVLGPLIARFGRARVAMPGGCNIGARKLDLHMKGLAALGVEFETDHGYIDARVPDILHGGEVTFDFPSVGATENVMMAAVRAKGRTLIDNAAREPEIADLANMLVEMGAKISGQGSPTIEIEGVDELHPVTHRTVGDRIEAGTFLVAGALAGGPVTTEGADPAHLVLAIDKLRRMGCTVECDGDRITVSRTGDLAPADIQTLPHPGFPTDLQAQFMVLAALAKGSSVITENVFENRFMFASELSRMGADVRIEGHHALVNGVAKLEGAPVRSTDLRGGAALVLAGLVADGTTVVSGVQHIDRGYEDYVGRLQQLGANIERY